jgi:hypothetical protein
VPGSNGDHDPKITCNNARVRVTAVDGLGILRMQSDALDFAEFLP